MSRKTVLVNIIVAWTIHRAEIRAPVTKNELLFILIKRPCITIINPVSIGMRSLEKPRALNKKIAVFKYNQSRS